MAIDQMPQLNKLKWKTNEKKNRNRMDNIVVDDVIFNNHK